MHEVCFCGWSGQPTDRQLIFVDDGPSLSLRAACPRCGRGDDLAWLHPADRMAMLRRAARRVSGAGASQSGTGVSGASRIRR